MVVGTKTRTTFCFEKVGRGKRSWKSITDDVTDHWIVSEIRKHGGLMSSDIDYGIADDGASGIVLVGMVRPVGTFTIEPPLSDG
jgi:hypothetical protein